MSGSSLWAGPGVGGMVSSFPRRLLLLRALGLEGAGVSGVWMARGLPRDLGHSGVTTPESERLLSWAVEEAPPSSPVDRRSSSSWEELLRKDSCSFLLFLPLFFPEAWGSGGGGTSTGVCICASNLGRPRPLRTTPRVTWLWPFKCKLFWGEELWSTGPKREWEYNYRWKIHIYAFNRCFFFLSNWLIMPI